MQVRSIGRSQAHNQSPRNEEYHILFQHSGEAQALQDALCRFMILRQHSESLNFALDAPISARIRLLTLRLEWRDPATR